MADQHSLIDAERATRARVAHLSVDFAASDAVLSLYRAANAVRGRLTNQVLRPAGLTWTGFLVLWVLWLWDTMETRNIADSVGISKGTLTGVAKTLMTQGLIDRIPSTEDKRLVSLQLTQAGRDLMEEIYPLVNQTESQIVKTLPSDQLEVTTQTLRGIVSTCEELG